MASASEEASSESVDSSSVDPTCSLPMTGNDPASIPSPPRITSFTGVCSSSKQPSDSVQVEKGSQVTLAWTLDGSATSLEMDGANQSLQSQLTTLTVSPTADTAYVLHAKNEIGEDTATVQVYLHEAGQTVSAHASVRTPSGPIAVSNGSDLYVDPPVRLLPQWDVSRWGPTRAAGPKTGALLDWRDNCCGPTSAAMILRWFAEDCRTVQIPFPTKSPGSQIDPTWYPPRMGECFWPNADPPGKIALTLGGLIDNRTLFGFCAHYLKSGGKLEASGAQQATWVTASKNIDWMAEIRTMLAFGPVILGIGSPAPVGHYVVVQGIVGGALLIVDPGKVIYQAMSGGVKSGQSASGGGAVLIENWKGRQGYIDATLSGGADAARAAPLAQWPKGKAPGNEGDRGSYCALSGDALTALLANLRSLASITYPEGPAMGASVPAAHLPPSATPYTPAPPLTSPIVGSDATPLPGGPLDPFFTYAGKLGEENQSRDYTYNAYHQRGKVDSWFMKGRLMIDIDGAPNCYHPDPNVAPLPLSRYAAEMDTWTGPLDQLSNGGHPGNWFGMLTDNEQSNGNQVLQGPNDPFPGFCISTTSLSDKTKKVTDPTRYVDARKIPYIAFPKQIWLEGKGGTRFTRVGAGKTGDLGDYVTIVNLKDNKSVAQAIIADVGDKPHFGEVSPATAKQLNDFSGVVEAQMLYIVYAKSGAGQGTIPTADQIATQGKQLFDAWGGMAEVTRVLGLMK